MDGQPVVVGDADVANKGADKVLMIHGQPHQVATLSQRQIEEWKAGCLARFPVGRNYDVIYADPPWSYNQMGKVEGRTPYPTMTLEDLKRLPVPQISAPTCALFMWVTNPLLDKALDLIRSWGFEYKTVFKVWCKRSSTGNPVSGCGWWSRPSTEMVLVATRGSGYMQWKQTFSEPQEFVGLRRKHSEKPDEIRHSIRTFFDAPGGLRRIELFARSKGQGFDAWGLEVPGFFEPDEETKPESRPPVEGVDELDLLLPSIRAVVRMEVAQAMRQLLQDTGPAAAGAAVKLE